MRNLIPQGVSARLSAIVALVLAVLSVVGVAGLATSAPARADTAPSVQVARNYPIGAGYGNLFDFELSANCTATPATPVTVTIVAPPEVNFFKDSNPLTFTGCGFNLGTTIFSNTGGTYPVTVSVSGPGASTYDVSPATFNLTVLDFVTIQGVSDGATYTAGSVPPATCAVNDPNRPGVAPFPAGLSPITGPNSESGVGSQTATCFYSDTTGNPEVVQDTYTIAPAPAPTDTTPPVVTYTLTPSTPDGNNGWYKGTVTLKWIVSEPDSPASLTTTGCNDQSITADQAATDYTCSASSDGGSSAPVTVSIKRDATPPTATAAVSPNPVVLNGTATVSVDASDSMSGVASKTCGTVDTSTVGDHSVDCTVTDAAGNTTTVTAHYNVVYATSGTCAGDVGHALRQPVNPDGSSVFNVKSTIVLKLAVCDANGTSVGTTGTISRFTVTQLSSLPNGATVDEAVVSSNGDSAFRWDPSGLQWIFNLSPKGTGMVSGKLYLITVYLNDGTKISGTVGVK